MYDVASWDPVSLGTDGGLQFARTDSHLAITGSGYGGGGWASAPLAVSAGHTIEFGTTVTCTEAHALRNVDALLLWKGVDENILAIDYLQEVGQGPGARDLRLGIRSPDDAATVIVMLLCSEPDRATVRWSVPAIRPVAAGDSHRLVLASARIPPDRHPTGPGNLVRLVDHVASMASHRPDLICLPEMCASWGVTSGPREAAIERAPFLGALGDAARAAQSFVVAAFYERVGSDVHNTALVVDRAGDLVGEYSKTHLTTLEKLAGVRAGRELGVFETEIGVIGMVICWDLWFPEPVRLAALQGAEIIAWPFEQDRHAAHLQHVPAARAMENGVVIVGASQATAAPIVDADGTTLAALVDGSTAAYAEIEIGAPARAHRWPRVAPDGGNRRNLMERERNAAVASQIADITVPADDPRR